MMALPISVCVPHIPSREVLFSTIVHPLIKRNDPEQIIVDRGEGNANVKRNRAARQATQPYLFFCDDDVLLQRDCLAHMLNVLREHSNASFCYSDFYTINHPTRKHASVHAGSWDVDRLRRENYISMMSLIRRAAFEQVGGMDESLERFQDYDLWLRMMKAQMMGVYTKKNLFAPLYIDNGITKAGTEEYMAALAIVHRKHGYK